MMVVDEGARLPGGWAVLSIREWILRFYRLGLVSNPLKCIHVAQLEKIKRHRHHVQATGMSENKRMFVFTVHSALKI